MSRAWFDAGGASAAVRALPWPYSAALLWSCEQEEHLWSTLQDCYQTAGIRDRYVNPPLVEVSGWPCWHPGAAVRVPGSVLTVSAPPPPGALRAPYAVRRAASSASSRLSLKQTATPAASKRLLRRQGRLICWQCQRRAARLHRARLRVTSRLASPFRATTLVYGPQRRGSGCGAKEERHKGATTHDGNREDGRVMARVLTVACCCSFNFSWRRRPAVRCRVW